MAGPSSTVTGSGISAAGSTSSVTDSTKDNGSASRTSTTASVPTAISSSSSSSSSVTSNTKGSSAKSSKASTSTESSPPSLTLGPQTSETVTSYVLVSSAPSSIFIANTVTAYAHAAVSTQFSGSLANTSTIQEISTPSVTASSSTSITTVPSTDSSTVSSTITSLPSTTFATSTSSSATSSLSSVDSSLASPEANTIPTGVSSAADQNHIHVAGVVVASVMGFLALMTILFLLFRYCRPFRRRYDAWQDKKQVDRAYREAIDGVGVPADKLSYNGFPKPASLAGPRFYASAEPPEHTTRVPEAKGLGLGLGSRLSLLRQHSPFQSSTSAPRVSQIGRAISDQQSTRGTLPR